MNSGGGVYVHSQLGLRRPALLDAHAERFPLLSVPYPQELNDIPTIVPNRRSHVEFVDMIIANLVEMERQVARTGQALVMGISLHPYIMGQPFRLHELRRAMNVLKERQSSGQIWLTRAGDVAEHFAGLDLNESTTMEEGQ